MAVGIHQVVAAPRLQTTFMIDWRALPAVIAMEGHGSRIPTDWLKDQRHADGRRLRTLAGGFIRRAIAKEVLRKRRPFHRPPCHRCSARHNGAKIAAQRWSGSHPAAPYIIRSSSRCDPRQRVKDYRPPCVSHHKTVPTAYLRNRSPCNADSGISVQCLAHGNITQPSYAALTHY